MYKNYILLLWTMCLSMAVCAQRADSVRWEHEVKLNEVVVTGLTGTAALKDMPIPTTMVTERELAQTSSTNIIDAVAHQPGVSQISTGGGISKPVIRGLGYNRVVVVNDGVRQEGQQWGDEHGVEIDPQTVGSVEILKGPVSLMYGSDAMAGVMIMHGHPVAAVGSLQGSVQTEYQTNNGLFAYSVSAGGNHGGFVWNSRWSQKLAHAYKNCRDGYVYGSQMRERAFMQLLGLNRRWGYSHLTLSYYHVTPSIVEGDTDVPQNYDFHSYGRVVPFQQIHHYKAVLDNTFLVGEGSVKAIVGYQQNRRQEFEAEDECGLDFRLHTVNYDVRYTSPTVASGWKWAAGIGGMYQRSSNLGSEYLVPAYRLLDCGAFVTTSRAWRHWHVTGGLRYDRRYLTSLALWEDGEQRFQRFSRQFGGLTGSLGVVFNVNDRLNLRANLARGFRAPNISELGSNGEHEGTGRYEVGNHDLQAESSWQLDCGLDFSTPWMFVEASVFVNRIGNYIFLERAADLATYRFRAGDARLLGGELLLDIHPLGNFHFENTFSCVDAVQLGKSGGERYLPFTPAPRWTSSVRYTISQRLGAFILVGLECYFAQNHAHTSNATETRTPSYTLLNASAGTNLNIGGHKVATLTLVASNIADRAYQSHLSRLKYIGERGFHDMGRNVSLKLSIPLVFKRT